MNIDIDTRPYSQHVFQVDSSLHSLAVQKIMMYGVAQEEEEEEEEEEKNPTRIQVPPASPRFLER